jgi:hypothetical protein
MAAMKPMAMRRLVSLVLVVCGVLFLAYGLLLHGAVVSPKAGDANSVAMDQLEPALISGVSVGGLTRDAQGQITKTYAGGAAPTKCKT